jgi:hypothetical protein
LFGLSAQRLNWIRESSMRASCLAFAQIGRPWIVAGTVRAQLVVGAADQNTQLCDTRPRMRRLLIVLAVALTSVASTLGQTDQPIAELLKIHQYDLAAEGKALLEKEARAASFFLIGGLHGDKETPALVDSLWPTVGYQYLAAEMSPWAASRLKVPHMRGSDIEEPQPHSLIRALAEANPQNQSLQSMLEVTKDGYKRPQATQLLALARSMGNVKDSTPGGISLREQVIRTLEVEAERANRQGNDRLAASVRRETVMKEFFLAHYRAAGGKPKVMTVFGQNHLHRGIDRRGVSTLGNFIAELANAEGVRSFHVVLFAAGGKINFFGLQDIDQRKDDPTFGVFASAARYPATLFDLRPIRRALHQIPYGKLSASDSGLLYWADTYDAIVCYREVTPADR